MPQPWPQPQPIVLSGRGLELRPLDTEHDAQALFEISHGTSEKEAIWKYLLHGPFTDADEMQAWLQDEMSGADPLSFVVWHESQGAARPVGMLAIMAIVPEHGRAEIGHVWMSAEVHSSGLNTRAQFLVLKYLLDDLGYRRVEWKCNARNAASREAAHRMGFVFEGRFRQHMVVKGLSRDTDWFSLIDKDWPRCKASFEAWLGANGQVSLSELNHGI